MIHVYLDGSKIELGYGDSRLPGVRTGVHTNCHRTYVRMNDGPWHLLGNGARSFATARLYILAAETAREAFELIAEPDHA